MNKPPKRNKTKALMSRARNARFYMFYLPFFKAQRWYFDTHVKECTPIRYLNKHQMMVINRGKQVVCYESDPVFYDDHIDYDRICEYFDTYLAAFGLSLNHSLMQQHVDMYEKVWKKTALTDASLF